MSADVSFDVSPVAAWVDEAFALVPSLDGPALDAALLVSERLVRRVDALRSAVIGRGTEVARRKADGHRRVSGWVCANASATLRAVSASRVA